MHLRHVERANSNHCLQTVRRPKCSWKKDDPISLNICLRTSGGKCRSDIVGCDEKTGSSWGCRRGTRDEEGTCALYARIFVDVSRMLLSRLAAPFLRTLSANRSPAPELFNLCPPTLALCVLVALISRATVLDQYSMPRPTDPPSLLFLFLSFPFDSAQKYLSSKSQLRDTAPGMRDKIWVGALNCVWRMPRPGEPRPSTQKTEASMTTHGLQ